MYRSESEEKEMLDPGLVLTGTKCGSHHVGTVLPVMASGRFRVTTFPSGKCFVVIKPSISYV